MNKSKRVFLGLMLLVSNITSAILVEVAFGELVDKITILEIKLERIEDERKLHNIATELETLQAAYEDLCVMIACPDELLDLKKALKKTNEQLWDIEDRIRDKERTRSFDGEFIALARSVYITNDHRCELKREINLLLGSRLVEEKSYAAY